MRKVKVMTNNTDIGSAAHAGGSSELATKAAQGIEQQRVVIDKIDDEIVRLLAQRFEATRRVGELKAQAGFAPLDKTREQQQKERLTRIAHECGLEEEIAQEYLYFVVTQSKKRHKKIASELEK